MKRKLQSILIFIIVYIFSTSSVFAHVVVKPAEVGAATFQTFTIGVPNEKDNPVVGLRLVIPEGLKYASPTVKAGWRIDIRKSSEQEDARVTEIEWTGGSIPEGQRDDFTFSAQVPTSETIINWKAYQTYQNGDVVSWDQPINDDMSQDDKEKREKAGKGAYSQTKVINDLNSDDNSSSENNSKNNNSNQVSALALALSVVAVIVAFRKK